MAATKRWCPRKGVRVLNPKIDAFLEEIERVCEKHGFDIGHEDQHGAFEIVDYGEGSGALNKAHDCTRHER